MLLVQRLIYHIPLPLVFSKLERIIHNLNTFISVQKLSRFASHEFKDEIEFWQQALPGHLKGQACFSILLFCLASLDTIRLMPGWSKSLNGREPLRCRCRQRECQNNRRLPIFLLPAKTRARHYFTIHLVPLSIIIQEGPTGGTIFCHCMHVHPPLIDSVELTVQRVQSTTLFRFVSKFLKIKIKFWSWYSILFSFPTVHALNRLWRIFLTWHHIEPTIATINLKTNGVDLYSDIILLEYHQRLFPLLHISSNGRLIIRNECIARRHASSKHRTPRRILAVLN